MRKKIDTKTPDILLTDYAHYQLVQIFKYTKIITSLVGSLNAEKLYEILIQDLPLQHALIFCFKVIGMHVSNAAENLSLKVENMPLFCKELHYLRNSLIHHCPTTAMPKPALVLLAKISASTGHIYKYFSLVCDARNMQVDLKGQRYKVFLDVHELAAGLRQKAYPKENRGRISQAQYLEVVISAIRGIRALTNGVELTVRSLQSMRNNPDRYKTYFALQNLCELIATIMNPNPEYALLNRDTILAVRERHSDIETWLRSLGKSRVEAMHGTGFIAYAMLVIHIQELCLMEPYLSSVSIAQSSSKPTSVILPLPSKGSRVASSALSNEASRSQSYDASLFPAGGRGKGRQSSALKTDSDQSTSLPKVGSKDQG